MESSFQGGAKISTTMQVISPYTTTQLKQNVATIGFFDGVHVGHRFLIDQVRSVARRMGLATALITFRIHPRKVMNSEYRPLLLNTPDEKQTLLEQTEVDYCVMMEFTRQLSELSAKEFMTLLRDRYRVACLVIGYDHRFGHNRSEGFEDYCRYGEELGIQVIQATAYTDHESNVSSSLVRSALQRGEVDAAARYLGYPYFVEGTVVGGRQNGRKIGFPTANIRVSDPDKLIPQNGVYAVTAVVNGERRGGMLNIGVRPTFHNGNDRSLEVHLFDFEGDVYGLPITIYFHRFVRSEQKFADIDTLTRQLEADASAIRDILKEIDL